MLPPTTLWNTFLAATPILTVLYLMIGRHWGGSKAGPAGWTTAVFISLLFFGTHLSLLLVAWVKAIFLAWFVLYIIWMALLLYHTLNEAGVITAIGATLPTLAQDKPAQALLIAWVFGSFLQGATGFGVPAAVVAPLLVTLGFAANTAVVMALLGHAWAVTFGSLGSSFLALIATTGLPGQTLVNETAVLLAICCLGCGAGVLWLAGKGTAVRQRAPFLLLLTLVMGAAQWGIAHLGLWTLAAFGAGLIGLIVSIITLTRSQPPQKTSRYGRLFRAFAPYLLLIIIIVLGQTTLAPLLSAIQIDPTYPRVTTNFGWVTPAGTGRSINLLGHAGALLLYTSLILFLWYSWRGAYIEKGRHTIWQKTIKGSIKPTIGIYTLVAMALTMQHAGMTQLLAQAFSDNTGPIFPLISPFIGALGAFMTGSNTNSNVVFGQLQYQTALTLDLPVALILAAQTAGGAIGGVFAPAKVLVGCSTVTGTDDGQVLKSATLYSLLILLIIGLITLIITLI